jgi:RNA polymerase sigma-70 factor (ECF subfamily)
LTEQEWLKTYRDTVHLLYGYTARRTGGNRQLTEDIVQESYLRALKSWSYKTAPHSPLAWLKRVARNVLIDYLRQKKSNKYVDLNPDAVSENQQLEDPIKSLEIFMAISNLARKKAHILESFYFDGQSVIDIADELNISERAVEGQLRRARQSLKSLLPELKTNGGKNE